MQKKPTTSGKPDDSLDEIAIAANMEPASNAHKDNLKYFDSSDL